MEVLFDQVKVETINLESQAKTGVPGRELELLW